jgi:hypothetical protein
MKKHLILAVVLLLSGMLAAPVLAAEGDAVPPATAGSEATAPAADVTSNVPPEQIELMRKREEARQRRDELMKLRQQNIESMGQGAPQFDQLQDQPKSQ